MDNTDLNDTGQKKGAICPPYSIKQGEREYGRELILALFFINIDV